MNQPYYISGQKVWFSFWLFDADSQRLVKGDQFMDLHLVDHEGNRVIEKRIKVKSGRSYGQFSLPEELETHEYLIHLGFQGEKVSEYIYASKLTVYNKEEALSSDITISTSQENSFEKVENGGDLVFLNEEIGTKKRFNYDLVLDQATEASIQVLVRKIDASPESLLTHATEDLNNRSTRSLDLKNVYNHSYLQFDLTSLTAPKDSILPLVFIPETHQQLGFLKIKDGTYTMDATDVGPGLKTFYFNQFIYRAYIPPDLEWDYEKEKYKDNLIPFYEGEMQLALKNQAMSFEEVLRAYDLQKPSWYDYVIDYAHQIKVSQLLASSEAYPVERVLEEVSDSLNMQPMLWSRAEDYETMDNMAEFLFEIVTGIKAYYTDKRKDIRVLNADGPYPDIPLVLVNGVPTRDMKRVLDIPVEHILGAGVIKDHKSRGQYKYNLEARPYGAFASNGIILIKLKPDIINPFKTDFNQMLKIEPYIVPMTYPNVAYADGSDSSEVPDLRTTLLWEPQVEITRRRTNLSFYTSDIPGKYEIIINGVKKGGGLIAIRDSFYVSRDIE